MGRVAAGGDVVRVPPRTNIYTVLVIAALIIQACAFILMLTRAKALFGGGGLF